MVQQQPVTLVLGASENPGRYSFLAINRLLEAGVPVKAVGKRAGRVNGVEIQTGQPQLEQIDTVTLYLNPVHQQQYYAYILSLNPRRIIFNPGTENNELVALAKQHGIEPLYACTLVMLSTRQY
ncbi:MAG: CoA-binding protein [Dinghuibacter sp.]|nr:CoA-binding protein [Dinghuibacter sp.]